ncbi:uncharacterized protein RBU57_015526 [Macrochelys suwanniensis]
MLIQPNIGCWSCCPEPWLSAGARVLLTFPLMSLGWEAAGFGTGYTGKLRKYNPLILSTLASFKQFLLGLGQTPFKLSHAATAPAKESIRARLLVLKASINLERGDSGTSSANLTVDLGTFRFGVSRQLSKRGHVSMLSYEHEAQAHTQGKQRRPLLISVERCLHW